jgi:carboxylate-amine ligase
MASDEREEFTVGVEEEYQLVSVGSGELCSRARHVLEADWAGDLQPEAHETMLEVGTHVCKSSEELRTELLRLRLQVASTAATEELRVVAAGTHPFSRWETQLMTRSKRYDAIREHYARVVRSEQVFGMHVHVAIPSRHQRIPLLRHARWFTPHLLALSCSSPMYEGADTGFSSYRHILWRQLPLTGPFPGFGSDEEYARFVSLLVDTGAAMDVGTIYWSIRPHPEYPTIEYRIADVCPRVEDAVAIAGLARLLTVALAEGALSAPLTRFGDSADAAVIGANEWTVARYGLDATVVDPGIATGGEPIRDSLRRLLDTLAPVADRLGDSAALVGVGRILDRGNGADRMREHITSSGGSAGLIDWLEGESMLGTGMDRRLEQRERIREPGAPASGAKA